MTLIEAVVALALLALLSVGLVSAFRVGERTYSKITQLDASSWDIAVTQRFLHQAIESAYPGSARPGEAASAFAFEGAPARLRFVAPMPQSAGAAGYYRYEVLVESTSHSKNLIVRWAPDRGRSIPAQGGSEILISGITDAEWDYLQPPDDAQARPARWVSDWNAQSKLPALVRLQVTFPQHDTRRWPEFVVAPRLDADTGCQFDSISQSCREAGL